MGLGESLRVNARKLKELRELSGRRLSETAQAASISSAYLSMLERGQRQEMSPPVAARLAKALGCSIVDLRAVDEEVD